jgi:NAD(P)-dependent dehydrogenase (short-subunit alcohol dehydrogenase family)
MMADQETALIVGVGTGLSASLARLFAGEGMRVALAARNTEKLAELAGEVQADTYACDVADPVSVATLFADLDRDMGTPDLVVFNPSYRVRGPFVGLDVEEVRKTLMVTCYGAFLVGQQAARRMEEKGGGTILFTGASAGVKGYPQSAPFAMGKFGLRGLAQSMARELQPKNIHIGHFVIDGGIGRAEGDTKLEPDAIAQTYLHVHRQHRSAWTWEVELRPWVENF